MADVWKDGVEKLEAVIPLKGNVITVTYSNEPCSRGEDQPLRTCIAIQKARTKILNVTDKNTACFGGRYYLGFLEKPMEGHEHFLANIEHIFSSIPVARRFFASVPPRPVGLGKYVIMAPLEETDWYPDLVLFVANACQASRLLGIAAYDVGTVTPLSGFTAACHSAISIPIITGNVEVAFIDYPAREFAGFKDEELIVTFPITRFRALVENVDKSRCGTRKMEPSGEPHP